MSNEEKQATASMTTEEFAGFIDGMIEKLQTKADTVNNEINGKLEDMSKRIDGLERSLNEVLTRMEQSDESRNSSGGGGSDA